jgi:hypothetical protein
MAMDVKKVFEVSNAIKPMLRGLCPEVQGAVLADLFAVYLASHQGPDAAEYREILIAEWIEFTRALVELNEQEIRAAARMMKEDDDVSEMGGGNDSRGSGAPWKN